MRSRPRALVDLRDGLWEQVSAAVSRMTEGQRRTVRSRLQVSGYATTDRQAREAFVAILAGDESRVGLPMLVALSEILRLPLPILASEAQRRSVSAPALAPSLRDMVPA